MPEVMPLRVSKWWLMEGTSAQAWFVSISPVFQWACCVPQTNALYEWETADYQNLVNQGREWILINYLPVCDTKQPAGQLLKEEANCSGDRKEGKGGRRAKSWMRWAQDPAPWIKMKLCDQSALLHDTVLFRNREETACERQFLICLSFL